MRDQPMPRGLSLFRWKDDGPLLRAVGYHKMA